MRKLFLNALALATLTVAVVACDEKKESTESTVTAAAETAVDAAITTSEAAPTAFAKMEFTETEFDFGTINEGDVVEHTFEFKNIGEVPLVISKAKGSCGCTVPKPPTEPIPVGETSQIHVKFNSKGKPNKQSKRVSIYGNTNPELSVITIKANVTPKKLETAGPVKQ